MTSDNHIISLPITTVPGCSDHQILGICLVPFQPKYLIVAKEVARDFTIVNVHFGKYLQLPHGTEEILASLFSSDLEAYKLNHSDNAQTTLEQINLDVPLPIKFDVCHTNTIISVRVRNICPAARNFACAFYGPPIE